MRDGADPADVRRQGRHLIEGAALRELLEPTHLRNMKLRVFHLALRVQIDRDLAVSFEAGYRIDRGGLAHDQAPKRVRPGISSGSPVISAVSAVWKVSAEGGQPGRKTSTFTNS